MAGSRWLFNQDQLSNTPSIKAGYTEERESSVRQQAANLLQNMGQRMHLNQLCMNTAIVYMHRFYMFHSLPKFSYKRMASAFIFLAAKVEEQPKKIEHVIKTYYYFHNIGEDGKAGQEVDIKSQEYLERVQELVINENILLQTLGFNVTIDHSNTHVVKLCQLAKAPKELVQLSYFLSTNSLLLTNLCLQYSPKIIAAICIHLACKWSDWELQQNKDGKNWWQYLDSKLTGEKLEEASKWFLSVMEKADPKLKKQLMSRLKIASGSSPNSRSGSPAPFSGGRSSQHSTPHRHSSSTPQAHPQYSSTSHSNSQHSNPSHNIPPHTHSNPSHSNYTPDRGHPSKPPAPPAVDSGPARTYGEHRERISATNDASGKSRSYHAESPLVRQDLKRPLPKDPHTHSQYTHNSSSSAKPYDMAANQPPLPNSQNPYSKQSRNHNDASKARHYNRHHPHMPPHSQDHSPLKKQKLAGENGNGQQRPPLPSQPPPPRPPPP